MQVCWAHADLRYAAAATHHAVASWAKAEEWCTTQSGTTVTQSPFCALQAHSCCCVDLRAASTARRNPSAAGRCRYHPHFCLDVSAKSAAGLPDGQWPRDACAGQSANGPQDACAGQSASSSSPPWSLALVLGTLGALPCTGAGSLPATRIDIPDFCGCSWGLGAEPVSGLPACQKEEVRYHQGKCIRHAAVLSMVQAAGLVPCWQV